MVNLNCSLDDGERISNVVMTSSGERRGGGGGACRSVMGSEKGIK